MKKLLFLLTLLTTLGVEAGDLKSTVTSAGKIVLTDEPCEFKFDQPTNFKQRAYATDIAQELPHEGCWYKDSVLTDAGEMHSINIYYPEINATGYYNPAIFE